jgi:hypothetical protein
MGGYGGPSLFLPSVNLSRNNSLSIPSGVTTFVPWEVEVLDTGGFFDLSNPTRITLSSRGLYLFGSEGTLSAGAGNRTQSLIVRLNGGANLIALSWFCPTGLSASIIGTSLHVLNAGDYLEFGVSQDSGGAVNLVANPPNEPQFWLIKMGNSV